MTRHPAMLPGLLATLVIATAPMAHAQDASKASRFYEDALKRYNASDFPGAIVQLKNALQADKTQLPSHLLLAKALLNDSQPAVAEFQFDEALRLGVNRAEVVVPLARALSEQGRQPQLLDDPRLRLDGLPAPVRQQLLLVRAGASSDLGDARTALASIREARAIAPSQIDSWLAEVPLRIRAAAFADAHAAADEALRLQPDNAEALYQKGSIYQAAGQMGEAMGFYNKALATQPRHVDARLARAGLYVDLQHDADAAADLAEFQRTYPNDPRAVYLRSLLADRAGDTKAAKALLKRITDLLDPVPIEYIRFRPQMLMLTGLAHHGLGELEKAKPFLELAARQQPGSPLNKLLARIALTEHNPPRAIELLEDYNKVHPGDGQAQLMLAGAYMSTGRHARALQLMQEAVKSQDAPEFHTALGLSLLQSGKGQLAGSELAKAYAQDPRQIHAGLALVMLHLRQQQPAMAVKVAEQLVRANSNNPSVLSVAGYARLQNGDFAGARQNYEQALRLNPQLLEPKLGLARVDIRTGAFDAANRRLRELLRGQERNVAVLFELAILNEQWGRDNEALKWLESAVDASGPRDTLAATALVTWALSKNQPGKALDAAKMLLAKTPEDVQALQAYAAAQLANGDQPGARATLTNAARRAAFDAPRLVEVARQQVLAKDLGGAAYSLDKAINAAPDLFPAQAMMASVELLQGDAEKSERRARQLVQKNPNSALAYNLLAEALQVRGQAAPALDALRKANDIERSSASLIHLMRALAAGSGNGNAAVDLAEGWLRKNPADALVRNALAETWVRKGNLQSARREYETVVKQQPNAFEPLNNLANVLMQQGDASAVAMAERALATDPRNPIALDTAGWANHLAGKRERALQLLRDARLRAPDNAETRYHLGTVLARAGRNNEAKDELAAALRNGVNSSWAAEARRLLATLN